jgi:7-cyano-7-deazaguanine synthase in queuosine biosynthesis
MVERDLEPTDKNKHLELMTHMDVLVSHPFRFIEKSWVIAQYRELDLLDLFHITRSCEGDNSTRPEVFMELDYKTYQPNQPVPICGRCFWCRERKWALEQYNFSNFKK